MLDSFFFHQSYEAPGVYGPADEAVDSSGLSFILSVREVYMVMVAAVAKYCFTPDDEHDSRIFLMYVRLRSSLEGARCLCIPHSLMLQLPCKVPIEMVDFFRSSCIMLVKSRGDRYMCCSSSPREEVYARKGEGGNKHIYHN